MPETFPTTPRASRAVRLGAIAVGLLAVALATRTTLTSAAWVGRVFPGFFLLDNRVVASVGLAHWPGATVPGLYQSQVVAVDDRPVTRAADEVGMYRQNFQQKMRELGITPEEVGKDPGEPG